MTSDFQTGDPLISIIIATLNSGHLLQATIDSLRRQSYTRYELLIIDGNSTDDTSEIVRRNEKYISLFLSENDEGIYDAFNKGVSNSTGQWITFIGAGDIFSTDAFDVFVDAIRQYRVEGNSEPDFIHGLTLVKKDGSKTLGIVGEPFVWSKFRRHMSISHSGSLMNIEYFRRHGCFDSTYKIAGDYELLLRGGGGLRTHFVDHVITIEDGNGVSSVSSNVFKECYTAKISHDCQPRVIALLLLCLALCIFFLKKAFRVIAKTKSIVRRVVKIFHRAIRV